MSADAYWNALPARFKANEKLKDATRSAFERDFLISIRLNYLHIMFLLRRLILGRVSELDSSVVHVAQEMLGLVVDALVLRDELVNSGTNLAWKVRVYRLSFIDGTNDYRLHIMVCRQPALCCSPFMGKAELRMGRHYTYRKPARKLSRIFAF